MFTAIVNDKIDFVKIFLENGCNMSEFLTYRRLIKLYNQVRIGYLIFFFRFKFFHFTQIKIPSSSILYSLLRKIKRRKRKTYDPSNIVFKLKEIGEITHSLLDGLFVHKFTKKPVSDIILAKTRKILAETVLLLNA
jgi:hypothetical protein